MEDEIWKEFQILFKESMIIVLRIKWFDRVNAFHAIMSKSEHCWWTNNNYTEKLVTKILSQTTYNFSNIWRIMIGY
jgi:hypothetical protein